MHQPLSAFLILGHDLADQLRDLRSANGCIVIQRKPGCAIRECFGDEQVVVRGRPTPADPVIQEREQVSILVSQ